MEKYKQIGFKLTPQRLAILDYLDGNTDHPSADEIYSDVSKRFPTMSFATVYNTLEALRGKGRILELTIDPDKKRFDPNTLPHNHLICLRCRQIVDIDAPFNLKLPERYSKGFEITGSQIEFYGICPVCRKDGTVESGIEDKKP